MVQRHLRSKGRRARAVGNFKDIRLVRWGGIELEGGIEAELEFELGLGMKMEWLGMEVDME